MENTPRNRTIFASVPALAAVAVLVFALPGLALGAAPAGTARPATGATTVLWAYGTTENISASMTNSHNGTYSMSGWFGYHVILTQTNISSTQFELELNRTLGFVLTMGFCAPACGGTMGVAYNMSMRATDHEVGFANFTTAGSVYENGHSVPALAILNSNARVTANLSEHAHFTATTPNGTVSGQLFLSALADGSAGIQFSPALGLIPLNVSAGTTWNSSSTFAAHGQASLSISYAHQSPNVGWQNASHSASPSVNTSGTVSVLGRDAGGVTLRNGATVPVILLQVSGPFVTREGILWLPPGADLFNGASAAYAATSDGTVGMATDAVDWDTHASGHVGFEASETNFAPAPSATPVAATPITPVAVATGSARAAVGPGPSGARIQGQPESVAQAQSGSQCILGGGCLQGSTGPNTGTRTGGAGTPFLAGLFVAVVVVALAGLLAGLIVRRRRTPPPPTSAAPPYAATATLPPPPPPSPTPPAGRAPVPEEDPLGHLW